MTFEAMETSVESGEPVELYHFRRDILNWRMCTAEQDMTFDSVLWTAAAIQRTQLESNNANERTAIKVTVPRDNEIAELFRVAPPSDVVTLTIHRVHVGDGNTRVIWMGRVLNCEWKSARAILNCEPASISLNRNGLRRHYQRQCPHKLFGDSCRAVKATYEVTGPVDAISGITITVSEAADEAVGFYSGGMVEWETPEGVFEKRMIKDHAADGVLTMTHAINELSVGQTVTITPGCDHTLATCHSKYDNALNYGGFPYIPSKNPFSGSLI